MPDRADVPEGGAGGPEDPLESLRERIRATEAAAERLADEADRAREGAPPPRGWDVPRTEQRAGGGELQAIVALVDLLRQSLPAELQERLAHLVRELLLALRALIDWYVERLDRGAPSEATVEDIPID